MKRILTILSILTLILGGCEQPDEVTITAGDESDFEISSLDRGDTDVPVGSVDSLGVLPEEQFRFAGSLVVCNLKFDTGIQVEEIALSRVFFAGPPIHFRGRLVGFVGVFVGQITANLQPMVLIPHRIRVRQFQADTTFQAGWEYVADVSSNYVPDSIYTWRGDSAAVGVSIQTPGDLSVISPRGGSVFTRERPMELSWTGDDRVHIIISVHERGLGRLKPLLRVRPRDGLHSIVLPPKVLRLLPPGRFFAFTFIQANRMEVNYSSSVLLVQAASVYNSYIEIR